jgi:hypothetical protein
MPGLVCALWDNIAFIIFLLYSDVSARYGMPCFASIVKYLYIGRPWSIVWPSSISYKIMPNAHKSLFSLYDVLKYAYGDIYEGEPTL